MEPSTKLMDRKAREAADLQLFVQRYGRMARSRLDPNDRTYDRRIEQRVKRMKAEQLDALLRNGEDA